MEAVVVAAAVTKQVKRRVVHTNSVCVCVLGGGGGWRRRRRRRQLYGKDMKCSPEWIQAHPHLALCRSAKLSVSILSSTYRATGADRMFALSTTKIQPNTLHWFPYPNMAFGSGGGWLPLSRNYLPPSQVRESTWTLTKRANGNGGFGYVGQTNWFR